MDYNKEISPLMEMILLRLGSLSLIGLLLVGLLAGCSEEAPTQERVRPPDIQLKDLDGKEFKLSDTQGQVVLLTFFDPDCLACRAEAPVMKALHEKFADEGLVVVGIGILANEEAYRQFRDRFDLPYTILVDENGFAMLQYGIRATPTSFLIDRDVNLFGPLVGAHSEEDWTRVIEPLL